MKMNALDKTAYVLVVIGGRSLAAHYCNCNLTLLSSDWAWCFTGRMNWLKGRLLLATAH